MKHSYYLCPICRQHRFPEAGDHDICPHCGWENDMVMNDDPNYIGGANELSQIDFRLRYLYYVEKNPDYHWARDHYPEIEQIDPMECPVCHKFRFERLSWDDIYCGVTPSDVFCMDCGWHYDLAQKDDPNLQNGANALSLKEYRDMYAEKLKLNPNYSFFEEETDNYVSTPHKCPVCSKYTFEDTCCFDICPFCGWEDDGTDSDDTIGANDLSFSEFKKRYERLLVDNPDYRWDKANSSK